MFESPKAKLARHRIVGHEIECRYAGGTRMGQIRVVRVVDAFLGTLVPWYPGALELVPSLNLLEWVIAIQRISY
jgi:hypothetical protein